MGFALFFFFLRGYRASAVQKFVLIRGIRVKPLSGCGSLANGERQIDIFALHLFA